MSAAVVIWRCFWCARRLRVASQEPATARDLSRLVAHVITCHEKRGTGARERFAARLEDDERRAAIFRKCPQCGALPGSPCKRPSGHRVFGGDVHAGRRGRRSA